MILKCFWAAAKSLNFCLSLMTDCDVYRFYCLFKVYKWISPIYRYMYVRVYPAFAGAVLCFYISLVDVVEHVVIEI